MLTSLEAVQQIPIIKNKDPLFLSPIIRAADRAIKNYCKQELEQADYTEFYSGNSQRDIVLKQIPVQSITSLFYDPNGYFGQAPNGFGPQTQMTQGTQFVLILDSGGTQSKRGTIRRIGGTGAGFIGFYPENFYSGKLSAFRMPVWPRGDGNIKVAYRAGYSSVPDDLADACNSLVAFMATFKPYGNMYLSSESLGDYNYALALLNQNKFPEIGTIRQILSTYRDQPW